MTTLKVNITILVNTWAELIKRRHALESKIRAEKNDFLLGLYKEDLEELEQALSPLEQVLDMGGGASE